MFYQKLLNLLPFIARPLHNVRNIIKLTWISLASVSILVKNQSMSKKR
jgi:hypothetical protein